MLAEMKTRRAAVPAVRGPPPPSLALPDVRSAAAGEHCAVRSGTPRCEVELGSSSARCVRAPCPLPGQLASFPTWLTSRFFFFYLKGGGWEGGVLDTNIPGTLPLPVLRFVHLPPFFPPPYPPFIPPRCAGCPRSAPAARQRAERGRGAGPSREPQSRGLGEPEAGRSGGDGRREREIYEAGSASQKLPCQSK